MFVSPEQPGNHATDSFSMHGLSSIRGLNGRLAANSQVHLGQYGGRHLHLPAS